MYKEMLNSLLQTIDDPFGFKEEILKNQLKNHFRNKTSNNKEYLDDIITISKKVLDNLTVSNIISVCYVDENKPTITFNRKKVTKNVNKEYYQCRLPLIESPNLIPIKNEIINAVVSEIEIELTNSALKEIEDNSDYEFLNEDNDLIETIFSITKEYKSNWIVISGGIHMDIISNKMFLPVLEKPNILSSLNLIGVLEDEKNNIRLKVFFNPYNMDEKILFGYKNDLTNESDAVYAISTIVELGNIVEPEKFGEPFYSLLSKKYLHINKDNNYLCLYKRVDK